MDNVVDLVARKHLNLSKKVCAEHSLDLTKKGIKHSFVKVQGRLHTQRYQYAIIMVPEGHGYTEGTVVDRTARHWDETLTFPLVEFVTDWYHAMEKALHDSIVLEHSETLEGLS